MRFIAALLGSSLVSVGLFLCGAARNHSLAFSYLLWNLFLAWLPLLFAARLNAILRYKLWSSWEGLAASFLWLIFVPNSFYMISDFIHLWEVRRVDILYDAVMFTSFIFTGVMVGFASLFIVHLHLRRRFGGREATGWVGLTLLLASFAVYIGRDLRWNSWDILTNPGGLLFDVSDRLQRPSAYPQMLVTTLSFFVLLTTLYAVVWQAARLLQSVVHHPPPQ